MTHVFANRDELARAAASLAGDSLRRLLGGNEMVRLLAATGSSQLPFLEALRQEEGLDWARVELFHLDEYVGIGINHPASFGRYIKERVVDVLGIRKYHLIDGLREPHEMARAVGAELNAAPVHLCFCGIGENGHLAFNEPPADFEASDPYLVIELDEISRQQQVDEGWFQSLEMVPKQAITASIPWIMNSGEIICLAPERRKADAVKACLEGPVSAMAPASILRVHPNAHIFLDNDSASLLDKKALG